MTLEKTDMQTNRAPRKCAQVLLLSFSIVFNAHVPWHSPKTFLGHISWRVLWHSAGQRCVVLLCRCVNKPEHGASCSGSLVTTADINISTANARQVAVSPHDMRKKI